MLIKGFDTELHPKAQLLKFLKRKKPVRQSRSVISMVEVAD